MLTILTTTDHITGIQKIIVSVERLEELVSIRSDVTTIPAEDKVLVINSTIKAPLDWNDTEPPYVFPEVPFSSENLLAHIFFKLGNHQKAFEYLSENDLLYNHLLIATHLQFGYEISSEMIVFSEAINHNHAILYHYGNVMDHIGFEELKEVYSEAIKNADNDEIKVFTAKHYLNLLLDARDFEVAEILINEVKEIAISNEAINAINVSHAALLMAELHIPYEMSQLKKTLSLQQRSIAFYESNNLKVQAGLLLIDAAEVANYMEDYILSKELINKAIQYFKTEDIPEFLGEAGLKKAILLYTWSKNGSPQYYKAAIAAFQDTLKVFKRDTHPEKFAEIHHNLALIYSEIPVSPDEKPIWTAFCASSFKNALEVYKKKTHPYEFAMVSHNYATALMDFPPAKLHNNLDKANGMFDDALTIRTAKEYPLERALTLLNQLELYWLSHNEDKQAEETKFNEMVLKAQEVLTLTLEENLKEQARIHLEQLARLEAAIKK